MVKVFEKKQEKRTILSSKKSRICRMSQLTQSDCEVKPLPFVYIYTRTGSLFTDTPVDSQIEGQSDSPLKHIESKIS